MKPTNVVSGLVEGLQNNIVFELKSRYPVRSFHGQIVPSQIVPQLSDIVPQKSQIVLQKNQIVALRNTQITNF